MGLGSFIKVSIPNYLGGLPIPESFGGWFKLSVGDWISLVPPVAGVGGLGFIIYLAFCNTKKPSACRCNIHIRLSEPKIVDTVDIEEIVDKQAYCRCWKSKSFPHCDGSHGNHNKETGDNVGPLVVKRKAK